MPSDFEFVQPTDRIPPPSREEQLSDHWQRQQQEMLQQRMEALRETEPSWFVYSDTLGERPIDGMIRELLTNYQIREEGANIDEEDRRRITEQVDQNARIAPGYTQEQQMGAQPGYVIPMGKIM